MLAGPANVEEYAFDCDCGDAGISSVGPLGPFGDWPSVLVVPPSCPGWCCWNPEGTASVLPVSAEEADCTPGDPFPILTGDADVVGDTATSSSKADGRC